MELHDALIFGLGVSLGLSLAIVVVTLRDPRAHGVFKALTVALATCATAHAFLLAAPTLGPWPPELAWPLRFVAAQGIVVFWFLVRQLFDDEFAWHPAHGSLALAMALASVLPGRTGALAIGLLASAIVAHLGWLLVIRRRDDLDEGRRRMRLVLAEAGLAYVALILLGFATGWRVAYALPYALGIVGVQFALKLAWLALVSGAPSPLESLHALTRSPQPAVTARVVAPAFLDADPEAAAAANLEKLIVEERLYRDATLDIAALARRAGLAEYRVRRLVNQRLGHRNFRSFLNHYRLAEVASRLRDPALSRLPILTLALDAGFGSLGPFNRAFRAAFGMTPSEYRRAGGASIDES